MKKSFTDAELDSLHERTCYGVLHGGLGEQTISDLLAAITQLRSERDSARLQLALDAVKSERLREEDCL